MPFQVFTLANLRALVTARLQNSFFWTPLEVQNAINYALRDLQLATAYWQGRWIVTTVAGRVIYNIGSLAQLQVNGVTQLLMPLRMEFNGVPLDPTSTDDLDNGYPTPIGWQCTTTSTPGQSPAPQMWAPMGVSYFALYPADAAGNGSLQIDGVMRTPTLALETDFVNLETSLVPALVGEAITTLSFKRGGVALQKAMAGHRTFMQACLQLNSHLRAASMFRQYMGLDRSRNTRRRDTIVPAGVGFR